MAREFYRLAHYDSIVTWVDFEEHPYFHHNVQRDLDIIASRPIGRQLLNNIITSRPRVTTPNANSSPGIQEIPLRFFDNVIIRPSLSDYERIVFTQSGLARLGSTLVPSQEPRHNRPGRPFHLSSRGSHTEAIDRQAAEDGTGSAAVVFYNNAQVLTGLGEVTEGFIVLAHELIHAAKMLDGYRLAEGEEPATQGVGPYRANNMTENGIRQEHERARRRTPPPP